MIQFVVGHILKLKPIVKNQEEGDSLWSFLFGQFSFQKGMGVDNFFQVLRIIGVLVRVRRRLNLKGFLDFSIRSKLQGEALDTLEIITVSKRIN